MWALRRVWAGSLKESKKQPPCSSEEGLAAAGRVAAEGRDSPGSPLGVWPCWLLLTAEVTRFLSSIPTEQHRPQALGTQSCRRNPATAQVPAPHTLVNGGLPEALGGLGT